ncbi:DUF6185 family protein [Streptomyces sp. NBC_00503]|uniref:DUF6185 family protein n=1 Tax=Streptomyces sp. NBC_00503 TaxID=2903659 RepID=UPI003FCD38D1
MLAPHASLVAYVHQMRIASVAFFLAQLLALATLWRLSRKWGHRRPAGRSWAPRHDQ